MNRLLWLRTILLFIVVEGLALSMVFWFYRHEQQSYLAEEYADLNASYRSVLETYDVLSKALFVEVVNRQPVISLVSRAVDADQQERGRLRNELHRRMQPTYRTLLQYRLNQLHFHLPDLSSFLRMHRPAIYGDNLTKARPAVLLANQRREFVSGFEVGRHEAGFRFIFPLFDQQRFIGTVETSISYNSFHEQMKSRFTGNYTLLIKRSVVDARLVDKHRMELVTSPFSRRLVQERAKESGQLIRIPADRMNAIAERLSPQIERMLADDRPVFLATAFKGQSYAVHMIPLTNVAHQTEAFLLMVERDSKLELFRMTTTVVALVITMLVLLLCVYLFTISRRSQKFKEANQLFQAAIDALPYPFHVIDISNRKILVANSVASQNNQPVVGLTCHAVSHGSSQPCNDPKHPCPLDLALSTRQTVVVEHIHRNSEGSESVVEVHGHPIFDEDGQIRKCIEYAIDITERILMQRQLTQLAETDALTGVWNRRKFYALLEAEIRRTVRYKRPLSLLMMDVDYFKQINDTFGHDVGDEVLKAMVQLMQGQLRAHDLLARSGGEEFLILAAETSLESARLIAEKLVQSVRAYRFPEVENVRLSIGVATWQQDDSADELVKRVDQALYRAKSGGRDRWEG